MTISNIYEFVNLGCTTSTPIPLSAFPSRLNINKIIGIGSTGNYLLTYNPLSSLNTLNHVFPNTDYLFISNTVPYTIICPTPTPTPTPTPSPTPTPTIFTTNTPTPTPTITPTPTPTNTPTITPSPTPTNTPTPTPTNTPTNTPTPTPTNTPTPSPTPSNTPTPTPTVPTYIIRRAGSNIYGESGTGSQMNSFGNVPGNFDIFKSTKSNTYLYTFARSTGTTTWYAAGRNTEGQLGVGDNTNKSTYTIVNGNWDYIAPAGAFTVAISAGTNTMFAAGTLTSLQANIPATSNTFVQLTGSWNTVLAGDNYVFAQSATPNSVWFTTGNNLSGQLGLGDRISRNGFNRLPGNWDSISPGYNHTLALSSGTPFANCRWYGTGSNNRGQLGVGDTTDRTTFTVVHVISSSTLVSTGSAFTIGISANGSYYKLFGTGANNLGQLGFSSFTNYTTFTSMTGTWSQFVGAGLGHTIGLSANSTVLLGTGYNEYGQLGLGDTTTRGAFSQISGSWSAAQAGALESFALLQ